MKLNASLSIFLILMSLTAEAQTDTLKKQQLLFDIPVFDFPYYSKALNTVNEYNTTPGKYFEAYANPSMHQSLGLTCDLFTAAHFGLGQLFHYQSKEDWSIGRKSLYALSLLSCDLVLRHTPGFSGWLHEEYHRSVMTRFGVPSFDDMNKFPLNFEMTSVSHIDDDDLIRFKQQSPADFIRMQSAGIEGEFLMIDKLQRNNFFYNQNLTHEVLYLYSTINSIYYVKSSSIASIVDSNTEQFNQSETTLDVRDFTGYDFTGWVYDLFKPTESYTARGIHPSGNGIDRYIKTTDLTANELSYLKRQGNLQLINLVSPMLYGIKSIPLNNSGLCGNFAIRDFLTSFGNDLSLNLFIKNADYNVVTNIHRYQNYHNVFWAIESQLIDYKTTIYNQKINLSPRLIVGEQPVNQNFTTSKSAFLALAECKLELTTQSKINPYIEFSAKTDGWVAGNEFLNKTAQCRIGVIARFN